MRWTPASCSICAESCRGGKHVRPWSERECHLSPKIDRPTDRAERNEQNFAIGKYRKARPTGSTPNLLGPHQLTFFQSLTYHQLMPSDLTLKAMNRVHRILLGVTGGRLGWSAGGMPVIELTTTGRRSGQPRTTLLTSPYQEGATVVIVASRGGDDRHPSWYLNLRDHPEVTVSVGGKPAQRMRAVTADPEVRARLWPRITADHGNYAGYQSKTNREIPVVLLSPIGD